MLILGYLQGSRPPLVASSIGKNLDLGRFKDALILYSARCLKGGHCVGFGHVDETCMMLSSDVGGSTQNPVSLSNDGLLSLTVWKKGRVLASSQKYEYTLNTP